MPPRFSSAGRTRQLPGGQVVPADAQWAPSTCQCCIGAAPVPGSLSSEWGTGADGAAAQGLSWARESHLPISGRVCRRKPKSSLEFHRAGRDQWAAVGGWQWVQESAPCPGTPSVELPGRSLGLWACWGREGSLEVPGVACTFCTKLKFCLQRGDLPLRVLFRA